MPAENVPSVVTGANSTSTTGTTISPMIQSSRAASGLGATTRADASRPTVAAVSRTAAIGTTQSVRVDR